MQNNLCKYSGILQIPRIAIWLTVLLFLVVTAQGWSQTSVVTPVADAGLLLSGEHTPLIYTGQDTIFGSSAPCTTAWVHVGISPSASNQANRNIGRFNPEVVTVALKLSLVQGDSASVSEARFESAYDTTGTPLWCGDSSNVFIAGSAYNHADYGRWKFLPLTDTARKWTYPLRLMLGGYARLILESGVDDTTGVDWSVICEH